MPGTVIWIYAYVTTPINNLFNTIFSADPSYNLFFPNTISMLLPTILRQDLFANVQLLSAVLYKSAFTTSTALVEPYLDFGFVGMAVYGVVLGFVSQATWFSKKPLGLLMYCIFAQSIILSIFSNFLFYLPSVFQLFWIYVIVHKHNLSVPEIDELNDNSLQLEMSQPAQLKNENALGSV
jgi:oligosaccharide repeat unit polymerase